MPMNKPHLEFHPVDMNEGWHTPAGYPAGIKQKILASDLDETQKMGSRSRLLKFEPGVSTTARSNPRPGACCSRCTITTRASRKESLPLAVAVFRHPFGAGEVSVPRAASA